MNKLIRNFTFAIALIFTFMLFQPATVCAEEPSSSDTVTITFDLNGGIESEEYPLRPLTFNVGDTFTLPETPEFPELILDDREALYITVNAPEGKWFDAYEIDGERYEFGEDIVINKDTVIKYLWKDVIWIHKIEANIEAPIVGTKVDAEYRDSDGRHDYKTQTNRPIVNVPDNVDYYVYNDCTYWYVGENGYDYDAYFDVFQGIIEKDTTYKATIYFTGIGEEYQFADDLKVFINGKEIKDFYNMEFWVDVQYEIKSIENTEEYTLVSPTDKIDAIISFIEQKGEFYSFDIKEYLAITDEDIQKEVDFWNQYLEDDEKLTFEEIKAEFNKIINYGKNAANGKGDLLKLYELYLYNNGEEIHKVEGGFKIKLKITDDIKGYDSYKLIYIAEDGTTEDAIELKINGKYLEGTLSHLSMYALVGSNAETTNNPQTGDNIMFYITMLGLSMIGLIGIYTKKKVLK